MVNQSKKKKIDKRTLFVRVVAIVLVVMLTGGIVLGLIMH